MSIKINSESKSLNVNDTIQDPKRGINKNASEKFENRDVNMELEPKPPVGKFCYTCGPWICQAGWLEKRSTKDDFLESNSRQVYKYALKEWNKKNKEYVKVIKDLQIEISRLRLDKHDANETIQELRDVVNELTGGELDKQLDDQDA